ncbi:amino acid/polyamine/organocation transporter (APC superfamily) [Scopulibacillus darangshiensis]|uniref:Amino acid/polyamine/organocation transporter (APC superfamily) n=1 Tax=Scopulibacillus darangshiensis TaxID=442528 RepID=A0A4R2NQU7_9BACL|nr:APC family permease [Scopulibacillus darangshiensis]TCP23774.1 amino acid/polyamine/organocation transporter (APC superfamily) [Scopulibacillus darangshiensis]
MSEESKLKKVLGLWDVLGIAAGQIIGAGVMSLTGIAIQLTGSGVTPAYILSAVITIFTIMPIAILGSAIPTTGGLYRYSSRLLSPKIGFFWMLLFILLQITIALYAISFAQYLQGLFPTVPIRPVALILITVLFLANIIGVKIAAIVERWMVIVLLLSLVIFVVWGVPDINYSVFNMNDMFPDGFLGFFTAVGLISFATGGAQVIAELGGEMKNPGRDIPLTIVIATIGIGVMYAFMATIAAGVLPIKQVAGEPLTAVAGEVLPRPLFLVFMIGGAMFALATTLNATFSWVTKSILIACQDGWLPKRLGAVNRKFGTPHWLLTLFYLIGAIPIITGLSLETIAQLGTGISLIVFAFPAVAATQLPKKYPELYKNSPFKVSPGKLYLLAVIAVVLLGFQSYLLISSLELKYILGTFVYIVAAALYVIIVGNTQKFRSKKFSGFSANGGDSVEF